MIRSLAGDLAGGRIGRSRPFRAPHHSASMAALVGGGTRPRPGEAALAHLGVLFLDELPEFHPQVLDALRQPLESGETVIARANHRITYPSRIQLIAAMNPCRCGRAGEPGYVCRLGRSCADRYQARISGPMLDRIDLQIEVPAVSAADLVLPQASEGSAEVRERVTAARRMQRERYEALGCIRIPGRCSKRSPRPSLPASRCCATPRCALVKCARLSPDAPCRADSCGPRWRGARRPHPYRRSLELSRRNAASRPSRLNPDAKARGAQYRHAMRHDSVTLRQISRGRLLLSRQSFGFGVCSHSHFRQVILSRAGKS